MWTTCSFWGPIIIEHCKIASDTCLIIILSLKKCFEWHDIFMDLVCLVDLSGTWFNVSKMLKCHYSNTISQSKEGKT